MREYHPHSRELPHGAKDAGYYFVRETIAPSVSYFACENRVMNARNPSGRKLSLREQMTADLAEYGLDELTPEKKTERLNAALSNRGEYERELIANILAMQHIMIVSDLAALIRDCIALKESVDVQKLASEKKRRLAFGVALFTLVAGIAVLSATVFDKGIGLKKSCEVCLSSDKVCDTEWTSADVLSDFEDAAKNGTCSYTWDTQSSSLGDYVYNFRVSKIKLITGAVIDFLAMSYKKPILGYFTGFWTVNSHDFKFQPYSGN